MFSEETQKLIETYNKVKLDEAKSKKISEAVSAVCSILYKANTSYNMKNDILTVTTKYGDAKFKVL